MMDDEFVERCNKAIVQLAELVNAFSQESDKQRIKGKIEGVKLALDYYLQMRKEEA
jgi:hypothetical protein